MRGDEDVLSLPTRLARFHQHLHADATVHLVEREKGVRKSKGDKEEEEEEKEEEKEEQEEGSGGGGVRRRRMSRRRKKREMKRER